MREASSPRPNVPAASSTPTCWCCPSSRSRVIRPKTCCSIAAFAWPSRRAWPRVRRRQGKLRLRGGFSGIRRHADLQFRGAHRGRPGARHAPQELPAQLQGLRREALLQVRRRSPRWSTSAAFASASWSARTSGSPSRRSWRARPARRCSWCSTPRRSRSTSSAIARTSCAAACANSACRWCTSTCWAVRTSWCSTAIPS